MPVWAWAIVVVPGAAVLYGVATYNRLLGLSKRADAAWSDIDVQLKRRWDLIPALVETVRGYARHESETLEQTVEARAQAAQAASLADRARSEGTLGSAVGRLFALAEAYPDLKASTQFLELQKNLVDVENHLQYARRYYNAVVRDFNTLVEQFPSALVAGPAGFQPRPYFQLDSETERAAPQVSLSPSSPPPSAEQPS